MKEIYDWLKSNEKELHSAKSKMVHIHGLM